MPKIFVINNLARSEIVPISIIKISNAKKEDNILRIKAFNVVLPSFVLKKIRKPITPIDKIKIIGTINFGFFIYLLITSL